MSIEDYRGEVDGEKSNGSKADFNATWADEDSQYNQIDYFSINSVDENKNGIIEPGEVLFNYWNQSVKTLYENLSSLFTAEGISKPSDKGPYDAGNSFEQGSEYVSPWENGDKDVDGNDINYISARTDELNSVLQSDKNLDFTKEKLEGYITRLLMPQYARRVEIEDLNRNFWVISQNLEALNQFVSNLSVGWADQLVAELMGIWNNIYKIWQALASLEDEYNNISSNEKIRWVFDYGFGVYNNEKYAAIFYGDNGQPNIGDFTPHNFGILPYIKETGFRAHKDDENQTGVYYLAYNDIIDEILSDNATNDTIKKRTQSLFPIHLGFECKNTRRNLRQALMAIKQRNYKLIFPHENCIISIRKPILKALDFYRYYLYRIDNGDYNQESDYAMYWSDSRVKSSCSASEKIAILGKNYLMSGSQISLDDIDNYLYNRKGLPRATEASGTAIQHYSTNSYLHQINWEDEDKNKPEITIIRCFKFLEAYLKNDYPEVSQFPFINNLLNFNDDFETWTVEHLRKSFSGGATGGGLHYTASYQTLLYNYIWLVNILSEELIGQNGKLFEGDFYWNWNLYSCVSDNIVENSKRVEDFGLYNCTKFNDDNYDDHIWIDFANYIAVNTKIDNWRQSISHIKSITINEHYNSETGEKKYLYDWNISVPITKHGEIPYENIIRINKPFPNPRALWQVNKNYTTETVHNNNSYYNALNNSEYYISEKSSNIIINYIDGAMMTQIDYNKKIIFENNNYLHPSPDYIMDSGMMNYNIATSDMIDCGHESGGQSRLENKHGFDNPVVNLRYINGRTKNQEVEIITTKDSSSLISPPEPEIDLTTVINNIKFIRIGDYWPYATTIVESGSSANSNTIAGGSTLLTIEPVGNNNSNYPVDTYGYGAYYCQGIKKLWQPEDWFKDTNNKSVLKYISYIPEGTTLINYIKNIATTNNFSASIIFTKYGVGWWSGQSGAQWDQGVLHKAFYWDGNEQVKELFTLNALDTFFDDSRYIKQNYVIPGCFVPISGTSTHARQFTIKSNNLTYSESAGIQGTGTFYYYDLVGVDRDQTLGTKEKVAEAGIVFNNSFAITASTQKYYPYTYSNGTYTRLESNVKNDKTSFRWILPTNKNISQRGFIIPNKNNSFTTSNGRTGVGFSSGPNIYEGES